MNIYKATSQHTNLDEGEVESDQAKHQVVKHQVLILHQV